MIYKIIHYKLETLIKNIINIIDVFVFSLVEIMNRNHFKKYAFTLVELIFVAMIIALIMPEMFSLYNFMIKSNREIIARQQAIQQWYEFFERLNILMEDYTIDYEEYYNRQMVWCVWVWASLKNGTDFKRNVGLQWYCTNFTAYGNENNNLSSHPEYSDIYYCTSDNSKINGGNEKNAKIVRQHNCGKTSAQSSINNYRQSYGQYANLFTDVKGGGMWTVIWNEDDEELWYLFSDDSQIDSIENSDNIQELYLISHDWDRRLYFRRVLDKSKVDEDGNIKYKQYKIQMLRLRWFDAWRMHNFNIISTDNKWIYDGVIDTWACDTSMWFEPDNKNNDNCNNPNSEGNSVCWAYSEYYLPENVDDCWIDLTHWSTDLFARKITISPRWDSDLYWAKEEKQINPYMKIMIINRIYLPSIVWNGRRMANTISEFSVPLETTINMKDFYRSNY